MSLPIGLAPEARAEFDAGYDWYESRRDGLGDQFTAAVEAVFTRIAAMPRMHSAVFGDVRRGVVSGFPYCVFYREEATQVRVISVFHSRRDPAAWQARAARSESSE